MAKSFAAVSEGTDALLRLCDVDADKRNAAARRIEQAKRGRCAEGQMLGGQQRAATPQEQSARDLIAQGDEAARQLEATADNLDAAADAAEASNRRP